MTEGNGEKNSENNEIDAWERAYRDMLEPNFDLEPWKRETDQQHLEPGTAAPTEPESPPPRDASHDENNHPES